MYQVIAKLHQFKDKFVQPIFYAKEYKNIKNAQKFVEKQKDNKKYYFEINEKSEI